METNNILEMVYMQMGELSDYKVINTNSILNNIYIGRVEKIIKNSFAFITLDGVTGFIDITNKKENFNAKVGDTILVQVTKEGTAIKGPMVTTEISLVGKNMILLYSNEKICRISRKITKDENRNLLKEISEEFKHSVIFRSDIVFDKARLLEEYNSLEEKFDDILKNHQYESKIKLLHKENHIEKFLYHSHDEVKTSSKEIYNEFKDKTNIIYDETKDLFSTEYISKKIEGFYSKKVWLKSGGFIIIEETEALTVIDVNTGKNSTSQKDKIIRKTNSEAVEEIARQIKFRNISGIIIIDFIGSNNDYLIKPMKIATKNDSQRVLIHGITTLGLMEITRKKTLDSISKVPMNFRVKHI